LRSKEKAAFFERREVRRRASGCAAKVRSTREAVGARPLRQIKSRTPLYFAAPLPNLICCATPSSNLCFAILRTFAAPLRAFGTI
jgi:hypothetical protein